MVKELRNSESGEIVKILKKLNMDRYRKVENGTRQFSDKLFPSFVYIGRGITLETKSKVNIDSSQTCFLHYTGTTIFFYFAIIETSYARYIYIFSILSQFKSIVPLGINGRSKASNDLKCFFHSSYNEKKKIGQQPTLLDFSNKR